EAAACAKPGDPLKDGRSREALLAQSFQEGVGQGPVVPAIRLPDENPDENLLTVENPHDLSFARSGSEPPSGERASGHSGREAPHHRRAEDAGGQAPGPVAP